MGDSIIERAFVEYARSEQLSDLLKAPFFFYGEYKVPVPANTVSFNILSDMFDVIQPFEGRTSISRALSGVALLCDEFTVNVNLDDEPSTTYSGALTTLPVLSPGQVFAEVVTSKGAQNSTPTYALGDSTTDLIFPFSNGKGVRFVYVPGARAFRFRAIGTVTTTSIPAANIIMSVTGRLRNEAVMLMAIDRLIRAQGKRIGVLERVRGNGAITRELEICD